MTTESPSLSVVVAIHNEELSLRELHTSLAATLPRDCEMIFVDDGSTDGTPALLRQLSLEDPRLRVLRFGRNFGKSSALEAGFQRTRGRLVATLDGDLQDDAAAISRLADKLAEGFDLAGGWRRRRHDSTVKVLASKLFNRLVSLCGGHRFRDINCGLKVMRREVLENINLAGGFHRFIPLLAHWRGYRVTEVEVEHRPRAHGKSRYRGDRFFRGLLDLIVILFLVRHQGRPGRYFVALGALLGTCGFLISAYIAWLRLFSGSIQSRFPLLALGLAFLVVGAQSFTLGLFGELLAYHFRSQRSRVPATWELSGGESAGGPQEGASGEPPGTSPSAAASGEEGA